MKKGKEYDNMISCTIVVSVSTSCSRCYNFASFSQFPYWWRNKKDKWKVEDKEVILIRPYEVSTTTSSSLSQTSFITDKVKNFLKYMKFVWSPMQMRLFKPPPHYQSLKSRGEQDPLFWKEVAIALMNQKHNTNTARNGYQILMFQGGPPHEPYFIAIDNRDQIIIGPSKKIVATHVVGELEVLIWFMRTWMLKQGYCYDQCLQDAAWRRVKGMMTWSAAP